MMAPRGPPAPGPADLAGRDLRPWLSAGFPRTLASMLQWTQGTTAMLVKELCERFGDSVDVRTVEIGVRRAVRDLKGSVSAESLPEMAARLAAERLHAVL